MLTKRIYQTTLLLLCFIQLSMAYVGTYSEGTTEFTKTVNEHGAILVSTGEQLKRVGMGVNTTIETIEGSKQLEIITIYVGKSCDAYSPQFGKGTWEQFNGGFFITFKNESFAFGRQEMGIETDTGCFG